MPLFLSVSTTALLSNVEPNRFKSFIAANGVGLRPPLNQVFCQLLAQRCLASVGLKTGRFYAKSLYYYALISCMLVNNFPLRH